LKGRGFQPRRENKTNCHPERRPNERSERGQVKDLVETTRRNKHFFEKRVLQSRFLALTRSVALLQDDNS